MGIAALFGLQGDAQLIESYFQDKVVWITGASSGLGEALCLALARSARPRGLVISARRTAELERVQGLCREAQATLEVVVLPLDLADTDSLAEVAVRALGAFGRLDVLVNNGGVGFRSLACETELEIDRLVMNVDYFSGVALLKALLPQWLAERRGHVVQISSVQGFFGLPGRTAYAAARHAAIGFYDSLRAEVSDSGVAVTMVAPGYIATAHSQNAVQGSAGNYPEGHTSKGVDPDVLAQQVLSATARRLPELVPAAADARLARLLRSLCPGLLFWVMRRRAAKEQRAADSAGAEVKGSKKTE